MPKVNCSVVGCSNSAYKINKWKKETCTEHKLVAEGNCKKKGDCLECKPPFHLNTFSDHIKCKQLREASIKALRREPFEPFDRVCSIHFIDRLATDENPIPTLFIGYERKEKKSRRTLLEHYWKKR